MRRAISTLVIILLGLTLPVVAQFSGQVTGTITDPTGAVVAGATIRVINNSTGTERTTQTDDQGQYAVLSLDVGIYTVRIAHPNFAETVINAVDLHVSSISTVNAQLKVGSRSDVVTVEANAQQVQSTDASLGDVVGQRQVSELPLNGRNFVELTQLQPGVSAANNLNTVDKGVAGGVDFSVNGNSTDNNLFLVDGAIDNDRGSNRTILVYPSIEAISEFKILTNAYGPEYGQAAGAIVNIVTKGGTNEFHGDVFYYGRNDILNARTFAAALATANARAQGKNLPNAGKDVLRRNDFGYSFGGPIKKDKVFFFWSQEWNRERRGQTRSSCVPTAAERAGNFSDTTGQGTTVCNNGNGNIFTPDPAGALFLQQFPLPTQATIDSTGSNWHESLTAPITWRHEDGRGDVNLTKSNSLMARYSQDHWANNAPLSQNSGFWGDDQLPGLESNWVSPARSATAKLTSTITSTLVNEVAFNYAFNSINNTVGGTGGVSVDRGNPLGLVDAIDAAIPTVFSKSLKAHTLGDPWFGFGATGNYLNGNPTWLLAPWENDYTVYTVRDDLSKVHGAHTFKVGVLLDWNAKNEQNQQNSNEYPQIGACQGTASFTCNATNPIENVLMPGQVFNLSEASADPSGEARWRDYEFYFGDTWQVRRGVTLSYGLRYSFMREPYAANNGISNFNPAFYNPTLPASDACNGLVVVPGTNPCAAANAKYGTNFSSGTPGPNRSLMDNNNHLIAPRVGVAWDVFGTGKTAIRAGVGQFFQREHVNIFTNLSGNPPFSISTTVARTLSGPSVNLPLPPGTGNSSPSLGKDTRPVLPNSWQWNFTFEQQIARNTTFQLGYVGNRGYHLNSEEDINQPIAANRLCTAFGVTIPGTCVNTRPLPTLGSFTFFGRQGASKYAGLQSQLRSRLNRRLMLQASYTFSKTTSDQDIANGGTNNPQNTMFLDTYNHALDWGPSRINRPHIFVSNAVVGLPLLDGYNRVVRTMFGNWEVAPIVTAESGNSWDVFAFGMTDVNGGTINSITGTNNGQNNYLPLRVPGQSCFDQHEDQIFNPAAFTLVGFKIGQEFGNTGRGYCEGPRYINFDVGIHKNFGMPFVHREGAMIQFRMEAFNLFNRPDFIGGQEANNVANGTKVACGTTACSPTNNVITSWSGPPTGFGTTTATQIAREFQYSLKFIF